jgi:phage tail sheath gpL-like
VSQIPITGIAATFLTPDIWLELNFNQGLATGAAPSRKVVLVGVTNGTGTWTAGTVYKPVGEQDVIDGSGAGFPMHVMYRRFTQTNKQAEVYCLPIAETTGGSPIAANGVVTVGGAPTASGTASVIINGESCEYGFDSNDTATTIGDGLEAAINGKVHLPVTAANVAGAVTLTAKWSGISGGTAALEAIPVRVNITAGTGATLTKTSAIGTGAAGVEGTTTEAASLATALAAIDGARYYYVICGCGIVPGTDTAWDNLKTHIVNKSYPNPGLRSDAIVGYPGPLSEAQTLAIAQNYERFQIVAQEGSDHTCMDLAAEIGALRHLEEAAGSDFTVNLNGRALTLNPAFAVADWPTASEQSDAIGDGVTVVASNDVTSYLVKSTTTRSKDATGTTNDWRSLGKHKVSGADAVCDDVVQWHRQSFQGFKLTADRTDSSGNIDYNQKLPPNTTTPYNYKKALINRLRRWGEDGLGHLQDIDATVDGLRVVLDDNLPNRIEVSMQLHVVDHLDQATHRVDEVSSG